MVDSVQHVCEWKWVNELAERLNAVMLEQSIKSRRQWCLDAGLSHSALTQFFARAKTDPTARMGPDELEKLASAANVSAEWLAFGTNRSGAKVPLPVHARPGDAERRLLSRIFPNESSLVDQVDLAYEIADCEDPALRAALKEFYRTKRDSDAVATIKHYLYALDRSADRALTEKEWLNHVLDYDRRIRGGPKNPTKSPFGRG